MTYSWKFALPLLLSVIGLGCAAPALQAPPHSSAPAAADESAALKNIRSQLDRTNAELRAAQEQITQFQQRLKDMDARLDAAAATESAAIQEMKESLATYTEPMAKVESAPPVPPDRKPVPRRMPKAAGAFKPDGYDVETAYKDALANYNSRKFEEAIPGFTEIITVAPASSLADNAQYWIGESYYSMKNYDKAIESFNRVFSYKNTNKAADARVKIGMTYLMMGDMEEARNQLNRVLADYPGTSAEKLAAARLETLEKQ